jgi:hypothetical protein
MTCFFVWVLVILSLPVVLLLRATESRGHRIRRWRAAGITWRVIAARLKTSPTTARRWAAV